MVMTFIRKKGQLSLEFVLLLLGIIVAGTVITLGLTEKSPIFLGNKSSDVKKRTMELFVGKADFSSGSETAVTNDNDNNDNDNDNKANVQGLFIKVNGNGDLEFYKEPLSNATTIGPNIDISVPGNHNYRYNLNGVINNGRIKVNGNGNLLIGNINFINNLYLRLNGNSKIDFNDVPKIWHICFITNNGFNSLNGELGRITGNVNVNLDNKNIDTLKVDIINGGGELKLNYAKINDITINKIRGNGKLIINDSDISNLNIQENKGDIIIYNSTITTINLVNKENLILYNSKILGGNIINKGNIISKENSEIGANINK